MNIYWLALLVFVSFYLILTFIVGRYLIFQDILPRKKPNGEKELKGYDYNDIEFKGYDGTNLKGWFVISPNNKNDKTIFLLHGWRRSRLRVINHIKFFVDSGFNVFAFDQRGHGASDTKAITYGNDESKDLLFAVKYAETLNNFNKNNIAAVGFSLGASAIMFASQKQIFKAIVLEGAFSCSFDVGFEILAANLGKFCAYVLGHGVFTLGSLIWTKGKFKHSRPIDIASNISPTPVLIIRGDNDNKVPSKSITKLYDCIQEPKDIWIHGGKHTTSFQQYPEIYKNVVLTFLNKYLT